MKKPKKNLLEWVIFAVSLVLVLGTAGLLIYEGLSLGEKAADPQIQIGRPEAHQGYFALPITVENRGDQTVQDVRVEVRLNLPNGESERGNFVLDYLPRHAVRHAWVTFQHNPETGKIESRILGYLRP